MPSFRGALISGLLLTVSGLAREPARPSPLMTRLRDFSREVRRHDADGAVSRLMSLDIGDPAEHWLRSSFCLALSPYVRRFQRHMPAIYQSRAVIKQGLGPYPLYLLDRQLIRSPYLETEARGKILRRLGRPVPVMINQAASGGDVGTRGSGFG